MADPITWAEFFGDLAHEAARTTPAAAHPEAQASTFESCLSKWVLAGAESEARHAAARIIRECRETGAHELNLGDGIQDGLGLKTLPDCIGELTHVRILRLVGNQLLQLPDTIGQMVGLQAIHLFGNQLSNLPDSICHCADLKRLYLAANRLTTLPADLGALCKLEVLSLPGNRLTALPESIGRIVKLRELYLFDNPLLALPASMSQLRNLESIFLGTQGRKLEPRQTNKSPPPALMN